MENSYSPYEKLDEAISDGFQYIQTVLGNTNWTNSLIEHYLNNKLEILQKVEAEIVKEQTLIKIITSSFPFFCDLAKSTFPDISRYDTSLLLNILADLIKDPYIKEAIISTYFKLIEVVAYIHDEKSKELKE